MSEDTRTLLDGCGLNIPASLSITLTAPKSPSLNAEQTPGQRGTKEVTRQNPSITLNDKSVDTRVLKALKTGQMRVPTVPPKIKPKLQSPDSVAPPAKKRKDEMQPPQSPIPQNILDLSGNNKRMDVSLKIPIPVGKPKVKPPNWVTFFFFTMICFYFLPKVLICLKIECYFFIFTDATHLP